MISKNPKIFCGYSDVTALSAMILKHSGLITFSAPMAQSDFGLERIDEFTEQSFFEALTLGTLTLKPSITKVYNQGNCEGLLFGGNLSTLASLCGQDFVPDEKFIFFVEDLNEPVYKIDRYFTQLLNIKELRANLSGILLGDFLDVDNEKWLDSFFTELAQELKVPVVGEYKITHDTSKLTIPYGAFAKLAGDTVQVSYC
jgi:muramoyltetrapeptide carboxypeptidase